jgi:hypothetical protein
MSDSDLFQKMKSLLDSWSSSSDELEDYPEEGVPLGTYVRSLRHDKLGVVVDGFYSGVDTNQTKIITYTLLLFPERNFIGIPSDREENFYLSNEHEYNVVAYLMMNPVDVEKLSQAMGGII